MGYLIGEKKGYAAAFDQLMSERRNGRGFFFKELFDQHAELNPEIRAEIAERQELILKEHFGVVSLAPSTDCTASRRCAIALEFERDRRSALASPHGQIWMESL